MQTTYTLYKSVTGGVNWGTPNELLVAIHPALGAVFCVYVAFAMLCVMNTITGVFVDNATRHTARDEENMMADHVAARMQWFRDVEVLFSEANSDGSGIITQRDFVSSVKDVRL